MVNSNTSNLINKTLNIPRDLEDIIDTLIPKHFVSYSDFIRDVLRDFMKHPHAIQLNYVIRDNRLMYHRSVGVTAAQNDFIEQYWPAAYHQFCPAMRQLIFNYLEKYKAMWQPKPPAVWERVNTQDTIVYRRVAE